MFLHSHACSAAIVSTIHDNPSRVRFTHQTYSYNVERSKIEGLLRSVTGVESQTLPVTPLNFRGLVEKSMHLHRSSFLIGHN